MMTRTRHIFLTLAMASLAVPTGSAMAKTPPPAYLDGYEARYEQAQRSEYTRYAQNRRISASQAKAAAIRAYPGALYKNLQLIDDNTYRVRLQLKKNGRIIDVYVDARTGKVKN